MGLQLLLPIYFISGLMLGAYGTGVIVSANNRLIRALTALAVATLVVTFVTFILGNTTLMSRGTMLIAIGLAAALLVGGRLAIEPLIRRFLGPTAVNILVIDDGGVPPRVPYAYHLDAREHGLSPDLNSPHLLDRLALYMMNMDRVMVSCPDSRRSEWAMVFKCGHIQGEIIDREVLALGVVGATRGRDFGTLVVASGALSLRSRVAKRLFDVTLVLLALVPLAPVFALTALAILLEDGGPVLFIQRRIGRGNKFFPLFKFRSMREVYRDQVGSVSTARNDHRITLVGKFIRRLSIDELPQLINVLFGHMSPLAVMDGDAAVGADQVFVWRDGEAVMCHVNSVHRLGNRSDAYARFAGQQVLHRLHLLKPITRHGQTGYHSPRRVQFLAGAVKLPLTRPPREGPPWPVTLAMPELRS